MKTLGLMLASALLLASCKPDEKPLLPESAPRAEKPAEDPLPEIISFNEHIQPILSENCYHCHGPDSGTREPKSEPLRLDIAEKALSPRTDAPAVILPGKPADSSLLKLIRSTDPDEIMPPPASHKKLSPRDIALLERWIAQGAQYQPHWSFIPPARPSVPAGENPIDHFVREKLAAENLTPNPPEEPRRFLRRLHLDLTGLPPSPEFTSSPIENLQSTIDHLLASPAAAEHQARLWLDAARYADTHGIHIDNYRAIWPYRDWVVAAFRQNMPWDQFTIEQIAGDLLPGATLEQKIATGFNRCLPTTGEGGAIPEEYESIYAKDRVETVSTVWLGLTTGCAACHDHKFDPISMADFYGLAAFFRNNTMNAMDGNNAEHPPNLFAPLPEDRSRWTSLENEISAIQSAIAERKTKAAPDFEAWLATATIGSEPAADPTLSIHIPFNTAEPIIRGTVDGKPAGWPLENPQHRDGPIGPAILANTLSTDLGDIGSFTRADQVTYATHLYLEGTPSGAVIARMNPQDQHRGWDLWLENGRVGTHIIDRWPDAANKLVAPTPLEPGKWHHVAVTFDGSQASHRTITLFIDGQRVKKGPEPNTLGGDLATAATLRIGSRGNGADRLRGTTAIQDFRFYRRLLSDSEIATLSRQTQLRHFLTLPPGQRTKEQTAALFDFYLRTADAPTLALREKLAPLTAEQNTLRARGSVTLVMDEKKDTPATAHILERGVYSSKGKTVSANTPASLPPLQGTGPFNRLDLAKWLVDKSNPLTARVTVNRAWQQCFGAGLVESSGDFGIMGSRPTHPKLLDWLAVEFIESGWDHRHLLKLIVTSETYRQSAAISPEKLERDPYNKLLSRGPRQRLDAEVLRDLALSASGLLSAKTGGPPVKPYQPEGIWEAVAMPQSNTRAYKEDTGENLYRRSLYTFWKRTAPPPSMEILNAPSREVSCVRRDQTNTPLQALVLLNDPQFLEACKHLAAQALKSSGEPAARLDHITTRLISRPLDPAEQKILLDSLTETSITFAENPEAAASLLTTGATPPDHTLSAPELAAWTLLTSQILNLDETLTR